MVRWCLSKSVRCVRHFDGWKLGGTAAIAEMLCKVTPAGSNSSPRCPLLAEGSVKGLRARGGFE